MVSEYDQIYLELDKNSGACPHCAFIGQRFLTYGNKTDREYWLMTEVFCYLHGSDSCNGKVTDNEQTRLKRP